jgi:hypothetical protein
MSGARFLNDVVTGMSGMQILLEDPSGNPIELFEPILSKATLRSSGELVAWDFGSHNG